MIPAAASTPRNPRQAASHLISRYSGPPGPSASCTRAPLPEAIRRLPSNLPANVTSIYCLLVAATVVKSGAMSWSWSFGVARPSVFKAGFCGPIPIYYCCYYDYYYYHYYYYYYYY
jgi:hypothetical protein